MPFNLRGGRPKNMGQGIYWVQRHLRDSRNKPASYRLVDPSIVAHNEAAQDFNDRFERLTKLAKRFFKPPNDIETLIESDNPRLKKMARKMITIRKRINRDIEYASMHDLNDLAVAMRTLMQAINEESNNLASWDELTLILKIGKRRFDFS